MGIVYLARQPTTERRVAIKVVKTGFDTREVVARFEVERRVLASMSHPNVAQIFAAGATDEGLPYFVMEYIDGRAIVDYCDEKRLGTRQRIELFVNVCRGVEHAHGKGFIHRDIKPSNCLVTEIEGNPVPKLIDFGITQATDYGSSQDTFLTAQGQIVGTIEYMSPEQASLNPANVDTRTDVYALGILLYELVTGVRPFDSDSFRSQDLHRVLQMICEKERPRPSTRLSRIARATPGSVEERTGEDSESLLKTLRADLDWIVSRALQIEPARRYPSAREFAADLEAFLDGRPVVARPPSWAYRTQKFIARHRRGVAVSLVFVAAIAGMLGWARSEQAQSIRRQLDTAADLRAEGNAATSELAELTAERDAFAETLRTAQKNHASWEPVWDRPEELEAWRNLRGLDERIHSLYNASVRDLNAALYAAQPDPTLVRSILRDLEEPHWVLYQSASRRASIELSPAFFRGLLDGLGVGTYRDALQLEGRVTLKGDLRGAQVDCFRFREENGRRIPRPFDVKEAIRSGVEGAYIEDSTTPGLRVERVWDDTRKLPFRAGDVWTSIGDVTVRSRADVARAVASLEADAPVSVHLDRSGIATTVEWIPFSKDAQPDRLPAGRVPEFFHLFGFTFEAYDFEYDERCAWPIDSEDSTTVSAPAGSYLLVVRRPGFADCRLPFVVGTGATELSVEWVRRDDVPPGFVLVPGGQTPIGGDDLAYDGRERADVDIDSFLLARFEVTVRDYLEFLNHAETRGRMDASGSVAPRVDRRREKWKGFHLGDAPVPLLPDSFLGTPVVVRSEAGFTLHPHARLTLDHPILSVSMLAGAEYADWRTRHHGQGRWTFRLPTDLEWERAARGADRRLHVWGQNYHVWSFARTTRGTLRSWSALATVGSCPFDESVFGVRDLAGSVQEPVLEQWDPTFRAPRPSRRRMVDRRPPRLPRRDPQPRTGRGDERDRRASARGGLGDKIAPPRMEAHGPNPRRLDVTLRR